MKEKFKFGEGDVLFHKTSKEKVVVVALKGGSSIADTRPYYLVSAKIENHIEVGKKTAELIFTKRK